MEERLALAWAASKLTASAMLLYLRDMAPNSFPSPYLPFIIAGNTSAHIIAAVPLEPATGIVRVYPSFFLPDGERLARINAKKVQRCIVFRRREFRRAEPGFWEFFFAIGHIFPTKDTQGKHLLWC